MPGSNRLAGVLLGLGLAAGMIGAALYVSNGCGQTSDGTKEQVPTFDEVIALLDRFDPVDTSTLPFVVVAYRPGFLIGERDGRFTVRYVDLTQETLAATASGAAEHKRVGYRMTDMATYAREFASRLAADDGRGRKLGFYLRPDSTMEPSAEALLLARACARRGLTTEAEMLWKAAENPSRARDEFSSGLSAQLSMEFARPDLSRAQLLERHRRWLEAFRESWKKEYVERRVTILERMVAEDRARVGGPSAGRDAPRKEELIAELIRDLREEHHPVQERYIDGEFVSTTAPRPPPESRPSDRLRELGFQAAPALIDAITDDTFTRCVWYSSRYGGSFEIVTTGEFADDILEEVSGIRFHGEPEERQAEWRSWWNVVSTKGEEAALAEIAARGDHPSVLAGKRFLERWPARFEAVIRGIRRAENRGVRSDLVLLLSGIQDERVTAFLLEELAGGPYVGARVDAARALLDRGRREGLDAFVREWEGVADPRQRPEPGVPVVVADFDFVIAQDEARQAMATFLLASGDLGAVKTVGDNLLDQSEPVRTAVLESMMSLDLKDLREPAAPTWKSGIEEEIERILVVLLNDRHRRDGSSLEFRFRDREVSILDPRTADLAAVQLVRLWPDRYDFDPTVPSRLRDRRFADIENDWRRRRGLPFAEKAPAADVGARSPGVIESLERVIASVGLDEHRKDVARLETSGLGALPGIQDRLRDLPAAHPAREDLESVADRLANLVHAATVVSGEGAIRLGLEGKVADLEGKRLEPEGLVDLLPAALARLPQGTGNIRLEADRLGDGTGVEVRLEVTSAAGSGRGCHYSVTAAGRPIYWSVGAGLPRDYKDVQKAIAEALATHHAETFEILIGLDVQ